MKDSVSVVRSKTKIGHWNNSLFQPSLAFVIEAAEFNQIINDLFKVTFTKKNLDTVAVHSSSCLASLPYIVLITKDTKGVTKKPTGDGMQFGLVINYFMNFLFLSPRFFRALP